MKPKATVAGLNPATSVVDIREEGAVVATAGHVPQHPWAWLERDANGVVVGVSLHTGHDDVDIAWHYAQDLHAMLPSHLKTAVDRWFSGR